MINDYVVTLNRKIRMYKQLENLYGLVYIKIFY